LDAEEFDVILLYELTAIQYCPDPFLRKAVANLEDPQALKLKRMIKLPIWAPAQRLKLLLDLALVTRYERKMIPRLGRTLVLSANDAEDLRKQTGLSNISDVPYGMTMPAADENPFLRSRNEGMIVFSGNMFHPPNVDGIIFFLDNIFHVICDKACNAKLWIVGNHPDSRIFEAAERFGDKVVITGGVPSVSDYLRKAVVSICPVRLKIGVQTKILEAMALGTPVVSTNAGNSGIGGQSGDHLWVEDEPEFFADRVVSLLAGDKWGELSRGGRRLVSARFGWESSVQQLLGQLKEVSLS
jgi:glycosyltransferase involved in cell wall biosynthesis